MANPSGRSDEDFMEFEQFMTKLQMDNIVQLLKENTVVTDGARQQTGYEGYFRVVFQSPGLTPTYPHNNRLRR